MPDKNNTNEAENASGHTSNDGRYTTFIKEKQTIKVGDVSFKLKKVKPNGFVILIEASKDLKITKLDDEKA